MNLTSGGEGTFGLKWSDESRQKISGDNNINFGKNISLEMMNKFPNMFNGPNNGFYGKKHSKEVIEFLKNRTISEEQRLKSSLGTRGSNSPNAKLTEKDVLEIRKLAKEGKSQKEISLIYNVKRNTINQIVHRKRWTHI